MKERSKRTLTIILIIFASLAGLFVILWGTGYMLYEAFLRP